MILTVLSTGSLKLFLITKLKFIDSKMVTQHFPLKSPKEI